MVKEILDAIPAGIETSSPVFSGTIIRFTLFSPVIFLFAEVPLNANVFACSVVSAFTVQVPPFSMVILSACTVVAALVVDAPPSSIVKS